MKLPRLWPGMVFGILGTNMVIVGVTLYAAHSDPSFAVEPHYYERALRWDAAARGARGFEALGWQAAVTRAGAAGAPTLRVELRDADERPIDGAEVLAEVFHRARAADRVVEPVPGTGAGVYEVPMPLARPGLWEVRLEVRALGQVATTRAGLRVPGEGPRP